MYGERIEAGKCSTRGRLPFCDVRLFTLFSGQHTLISCQVHLREDQPRVGQILRGCSRLLISYFEEKFSIWKQYGVVACAAWKVLHASTQSTYCPDSASMQQLLVFLSDTESSNPTPSCSTSASASQLKDDPFGENDPLIGRLKLIEDIGRMSGRRKSLNEREKLLNKKSELLNHRLKSKKSKFLP